MPGRQHAPVAALTRLALKRAHSHKAQREAAGDIARTHAKVGVPCALVPAISPIRAPQDPLHASALPSALAPPLRPSAPPSPSQHMPKHTSDRTMALPESLDAHHWAEDLLAQDCCRGRALVEHHRPQKEAFAERTPGQNPEHAATKSECAREQGAGQHASASAAKLRPPLAFRPQSCT